MNAPSSRIPVSACASWSTSASKALSPAVNDPYTAIQTVEHLTVLFTAMAARPVGPVTVHDPASRATVTIPVRSFDEHLALAVGLIRRYGSAEPTVAQALLRLLTTVLAATSAAERWDAIDAQAGFIVAAAERDVAEPADLAIVYAEADALHRELAARRAQASRHTNRLTGAARRAGAG